MLEKCGSGTKAWTEGQLYDVGRFPAGLFNRAGERDHHIQRVEGEVYLVDDATLEELDTVEGYYEKYPEAGLYRRLNRYVYYPGTYGEQSGKAWVYEWNRPLEGLTMLPHGNYIRYLREKEKGPDVRKR
jgi:gamma-glutamylcyclotransferase (GGCT)/AIG2-like uncharacterized protein YtfP